MNSFKVRTKLHGELAEVEITSRRGVFYANGKPIVNAKELVARGLRQVMTDSIAPMARTGTHTEVRDELMTVFARYTRR